VRFVKLFLEFLKAGRLDNPAELGPAEANLLGIFSAESNLAL
jgi:hypothetical protein